MYPSLTAQKTAQVYGKVSLEAEFPTVQGMRNAEPEKGTFPFSIEVIHMGIFEMPVNGVQ
ncbi:hypothetical protein NPIL_29841, partial [Nephila pilipes]